MKIKPINNKKSQTFGTYAILKLAGEKPRITTNTLTEVLYGKNILALSFKFPDASSVYVLASEKPHQSRLCKIKHIMERLARLNYSRGVSGFVDDLQIPLQPAVVFENTWDFINSFRNGQINPKTFERIG